MNNETIARIFEENLDADIIPAERCGIGAGNYAYIVSDAEEKCVQYAEPRRIAKEVIVKI